MFRRSRSDSVAGRKALLVLLPLVAGVAVLQFGERSPAVTTVLETTPASVATAVAEAPAPAVPVAVVAVDEPVPTALAAAEATPAPAPAPAPATATPAAVATPASTTTTTTTVATTTTTTVRPAVTTTTAAPAGPARLSSAEATVVPLTNADRRAGGLGTLTRDACLDGVASRYAEQLARSGVLAHNPGAGAAVIGCRPGATWGDNVGTSEPCDTALLEEKWMASPGHRRNILTGAFSLIGVGAWTDPAGGCWIQVLFSS